MEEGKQPSLKKLEKTLEKEEIDLVHKAIGESSKIQKGLERHPVILALLGAFGIVTLFYGFEKLLDKTILVDYPVVLLILGIVILGFTGLLLKKLL